MNLAKKVALRFTSLGLAKKVAIRFAAELRKDEFDQLMLWIGPKAHKAHRKFPDGKREFDTRTRVFRFNIDPKDYLRYDLDEALGRMRGGETLADVVNPEAYEAMRGVLADMKKRRLKLEMIKVPWRNGGSFIQAVLPKPKRPEEPQNDDPWAKDYGPR